MKSWATALLIKYWLTLQCFMTFRSCQKKADTLAGALRRHQGLEQIMISLNQFGFGPRLSMKIYQAYESETLERFRKTLISL